MAFIYSVLGIAGFYGIVFSLITLFSLLRQRRAARVKQVAAEMTANNLVLLARIASDAPGVLPLMSVDRHENTHPAKITLSATIDYMPILEGLDEPIVPPVFAPPPARALIDHDPDDLTFIVAPDEDETHPSRQSIARLITHLKDHPGEATTGAEAEASA